MPGQCHIKIQAWDSMVRHTAVTKAVSVPILSFQNSDTKSSFSWEKALFSTTAVRLNLYLENGKRCIKSILKCKSDYCILTCKLYIQIALLIMFSNSTVRCGCWKAGVKAIGWFSTSPEWASYNSGHTWRRATWYCCFLLTAVGGQPHTQYLQLL